MKKSNPVDHIRFFDDYGSSTSYRIDKEKASLLIPDVFMERRVRVYCKRSDDEAYVRVTLAPRVSRARTHTPRAAPTSAPTRGRSSRR